MAKSAIEKGLKKEVAYELAAKTALGTGKLLLEKGFKSGGNCVYVEKTI